MSQEARSVDGRVRERRDIVSVVDESEAGRDYVIADISRDGSWLSVAERETVSLNAHR
ncbi:DUF7556 family protein [Halorientalis salina]|uniref:DUF7556 family protein n=1 Tax=Halorientalis salina TaxID=2932266 RepID=UPI00145C4790|nr:hypothetical protein [Halorientalis salina]